MLIGTAWMNSGSSYRVAYRMETAGTDDETWLWGEILSSASSESDCAEAVPAAMVGVSCFLSPLTLTEDANMTANT